MTPGARATIPASLYSDVETLWEYHQMHHELQPCSVGIGLGSHDPGVATFAAELFHRSLFPLIVFTGANAPTTIERFPRGEAVHYREEAIKLGVPPDRVLVEDRATNTYQNIGYSRQLLAEHQVDVRSVLLVSRPYQQRRAYATCRKVWPSVQVICASRPATVADYVADVGDSRRVIDMLVGDTQRIMEYPKFGFAIKQDVPTVVHEAFGRLVAAGFTSRLIQP